MSDSILREAPEGSRGLETGQRRGWRPRRAHLHISFWSLLAILAISLSLVASSMALTGRVVVLPDWVAQKLRSEINAVLPSGQVSIARVEAGLGRNGLPRVRVVDVVLRDDTGLTLAQLNAVESRFGLQAALRGRLEPRVIELQGAQVTLRRLADGAFDLALGHNLGTTGNLATLLDTVDSLFASGPAATVTRLAATDLTVTLEDARSGRIWQVTDGELEIVPRPAFIDTTIRFNVFNQTEALASTEFAFRSARNSSEASLSARFDNAAARDIAAQSPVLSFLSVIDAPISGALRTTITPDGALEELAGALQVGAGALSPVKGAPPAEFDGARIYIDYDPTRQRIDFTGAKLESEIGAFEAQGHVYLADIRAGWPNSLVGQVDVPHAVLAPRDFFATPLEIDGATADLRVRLDPFRIDFGQVVAFRGDNRYDARGGIGADSNGWWVSLDADFTRATRQEAFALWPVTVAPKVRDWVAAHVAAGSVTDGTLAFRKPADGKLTMSGTFGMEDAVVEPVEGMPALEIARGYVSLAPDRAVMVGEEATTTAPNGVTLDISGTSYMIPTGPQERKLGVVDLALDGDIRGVLSVLEGEPFSVFAGTGGDYGPDMARGRVAATGRIRIPFAAKDDPADASGTSTGTSAGTETAGAPPDEVRFDISARLTGVSSDVLVKDKLLIADALDLTASNQGIEVSGPVRIGLAEAKASWSMPLVRGVSLPATVSGRVEITPEALSEFGLGDIAGMVSGSTRGRFDIALGSPGEAPRLTLVSDLGGLGLELPGTGWAKSPADTGALRVEALLGDRPEVTRLRIEAPGLWAVGTVTTAEGGGLGEATFKRVRLGKWLDAPVVLTGRGPGLPLAITVPGGVIDLRNTEFGGGGTAGAPGPRRPVTLALSRLIVTDNIKIRDLKADLDLSGGLSGTFTGRLFEGNLIEGTVAQTDQGAALRITSNLAGQVLRETNIFTKARDGRLELVLAPVAGVGTYEGEFTITNTRVVNAPAMAELLSAVSVVGLVDQLQGDGIRFTNVEGRFRLTPNSVTLYRSAAVGPSLGLSLDGYYDLTQGRIDMQGVLSPLYIVNSIGRVLSPRDGEGLVGFNFTLKGDAQNPDVGVNPLSILTPGVLREIFRRAPPEAPSQ